MLETTTKTTEDNVPKVTTNSTESPAVDASTTQHAGLFLYIISTSFPLHWKTIYKLTFSKTHSKTQHKI